MTNTDAGNTEIVFGDENGFHITARPAFTNHEAWEVTIWRRNSGMSALPPIRTKEKAVHVAGYLFETLLDEFEAEEQRSKAAFAEFEAEMATRPKPKPPKIPKNAPRVAVLECSECNALIPPDEVSDEHVYECGECGNKGAGSSAALS